MSTKQIFFFLFFLSPPVIHAGEPNENHLLAHEN